MVKQTDNTISYRAPKGWYLGDNMQAPDTDYVLVMLHMDITCTNYQSMEVFSAAPPTKSKDDVYTSVISKNILAASLDAKDERYSQIQDVIGRVRTFYNYVLKKDDINCMVIVDDQGVIYSGPTSL